MSPARPTIAGQGSMNPARSLAPGMLCEDPTIRANVWIFFAGPLLGATIAALLMRFLTRPVAKHDETLFALGYGGAEHDQTELP